MKSYSGYVAYNVDGEYGFLSGAQTHGGIQHSIRWGSLNDATVCTNQEFVTSTRRATIIGTDDIVGWLPVQVTLSVSLVTGEEIA